MLKGNLRGYEILLAKCVLNLKIYVPTVVKAFREGVKKLIVTDMSVNGEGGQPHVSNKIGIIFVKDLECS